MAGYPLLGVSVEARLRFELVTPRMNVLVLSVDVPLAPFPALFAATTMFAPEPVTVAVLPVLLALAPSTSWLTRSWVPPMVPERMESTSVTEAVTGPPV